MVQDRREPTMSSIKPERDEIMRHQQSRPTPKGGNPQRPTRSAPPSSTRKVPVSLFALILALVAGGAVGFTYWQLQQTQMALVSADGRIAELEAKLNLFDSESDQSVTQILERVSVAEEQYDLLWKNYRSHRDSIADNEGKINALTKDSKAAVSAAQSAKQTADSLQASLNSVKTLTNEQQLILTKVSEDMDLQKTDVGRLLTQVTDFDKRLNKLEGELAGKVAANEEAIKAIDTFRRSVNSDILQLKQQLSSP